MPAPHKSISHLLPLPYWLSSLVLTLSRSSLPPSSFSLFFSPPHTHGASAKPIQSSPAQCADILWCCLDAEARRFLRVRRNLQSITFSVRAAKFGSSKFGSTSSSGGRLDLIGVPIQLQDVGGVPYGAWLQFSAGSSGPNNAVGMREVFLVVVVYGVGLSRLAVTWVDCAFRRTCLVCKP